MKPWDQGLILKSIKTDYKVVSFPHTPLHTKLPLSIIPFYAGLHAYGASRDLESGN